MGFRIWLAKKLIGKSNKDIKVDLNKFDEQDKELNADLRRLQKENKIRDLEIQLAEKDLELAEIEEDMKEITGQDDDNNPLSSFESTIMGLFSGSVGSLGSQTQTPLTWETPQAQPFPNSNGVSQAKSNFTDQEMDQLILSIPKEKLDLARKTPDFMLKSYAKKQFPEVTDDDLNRFIKKIKG